MIVEWVLGFLGYEQSKNTKRRDSDSDSTDGATDGTERGGPDASIARPLPRSTRTRARTLLVTDRSIDAHERMNE